MILAPFVGSVLNGLILKSTQPKNAGILASVVAFISFLCAFRLWLNYSPDDAAFALSFDWFHAGSAVFEWGFQFDSLTAVMALMVTGIGTVIHVYSIGYMSEEKTPSRYFAYLNLFLGSMLVLISADNLVVLFVGWEGVGLCSYLLIGYWYEDIEKANAGIKAFLVNRVGDAAFLMGIFFCYLLFDSVKFSDIAFILSSNQEFSLTLINCAALFLFIGATGKSAQIPLYVWLPDAMAGPTPVSALIHAATMVTSGIYLIVRLSPLYQLAAETGHLIACIGVATAFFAATIATCQRDIKKVLAYSTVSQLGFMFLALGVGAYVAALFHVVTHAFFKALLFMGAGSIIHGLGGEQDAWQMGGLKKKMPWTFWTFTIGVFAIAGIPPLSGFFSKDTILFASMASDRGNLLYWVLGTLASLLTAFYMTRLWILIFFGEYRGKAHPHESPKVMTIPLAILAFGSVFAGLISVPHAFHLLPNYLEKYLSNLVPQFVEHHPPVPEYAAIAIAIMVAVLGIYIGYYFYRDLKRSEKAAKSLGPVQLMLENKYWVDEFYDLAFVRTFKLVSDFFARVVDPKIIDAAVLFPARVAQATGTLLTFFQAGAAQFYLWIMLVGGLAVLWIALRGTVL